MNGTCKNSAERVAFIQSVNSGQDGAEEAEAA